MKTWASIFSQSPANNARYDGDRLPAQVWQWPADTWFQKRIRYLRAHGRQPRKALGKFTQ
jgi:hypothetical protein